MYFKDKNIFITGCGSFATAFTEYLLKYENPKKIRIFSRQWQAQDNLKQKLGDPSNVTWILGDIRNREELIRATYGADIVVHSAAIKDIEYCRLNPFYAVDINTNGSQNVIEAAIKNNIPKSLLISTDKAVEPTTCYGKTKALAEDLFINANVYKGSRNINFSVARWGNIVGSSGSVVPKYKKLIADGITSLPLTHEDITRYWFKMEDAIQFVTNSIKDMQGGETFLPENMPSIYIRDLCKAFEMPYHLVGLRPDEKLHEKLDATRHSGNNPYFLDVNQIKETINVE